jgi:hypothetical protein
VTTACAGVRGHTHARAANTSRTPNTIQQANADSIEQARVGKFMRSEYQQRARPLQQSGNFLGELQLSDGWPRSIQEQRHPRRQHTADRNVLSFLGDPAEALRLFDTIDEDAPSPSVDTMQARPAWRRGCRGDDSRNG